MEFPIVSGAEHRSNGCRHRAAVHCPSNWHRLVSGIHMRHTTENLPAAIDLFRQYDVWLGRHSSVTIAHVHRHPKILHIDDDVAGTEGARSATIASRSNQCLVHGWWRNVGRQRRFVI